ncbi:MAG: efflux RND transporter periplasmic adaptor subunit [Candidatus Rokuibacteriota bacterium]
MAYRLTALCAVAGLALAAAGCQQDSPATAAQPPKPAAAAAPRSVRLVPAALEKVPRTVEATGTLAADEQVVLGTKVPGRLGEITVDLGSRVRKGQAVGRIDPSDYQHRLDQAVAALQQARARLGLSPDGTDDRVDPEQTAIVRQARAVLDEAKLTFDRMTRLWDQQLIARAQLDSAKFGLQSAEGRFQDALEEVRNRQAILVQRRAEVELARQQLADTALVSPIDAAVSHRQASAGEYLGAGAPVVTLVRTHPLRLRLSVPEREAATVKVGQPVRVRVEGDPTGHQGTVARLSPQIAELNRTLLIEAEVPNERGVLRPGAFARAEVVTQVDQPMVTVPASAIVIFAGVEKVMSVKDGKSVEILVQTGRRQGDRVEVVSGLKGGEPIVAQPGNLAGGQAVTVEK